MSTHALFARAARALLVTITLGASPLVAARAQLPATADVGTIASVSGGEDGCIDVGADHVAVGCTYGTANAWLTVAGPLRYPVFHADAATFVVDEEAEASAYLRDGFTFFGLVPAELRFDVYLHGTATGTSSSGLFSFYEHNFSEPAASIGLDADATSDHTTGTFVSFIGGESNVATFGFGITAQARNQPWLGGIGGATAAFGNTAYVTRVRAYDADGAQITSGLLVRAESGLGYDFEGATMLSNVTATPEPTSLALLAGGVLPLLWVGRRRVARR
jgi:hypothetical protein